MSAAASQQQQQFHSPNSLDLLIRAANFAFSTTTSACTSGTSSPTTSMMKMSLTSPPVSVSIQRADDPSHSTSLRFTGHSLYSPLHQNQYYALPSTNTAENTPVHSSPMVVIRSIYE